MLNSMVTFTFFRYRPEIPFWVNFVQKCKIVCLKCTLVPRLIRKCWIRWSCLLFLFWIRITFSLHKVWENTGFPWPIFSCKRTEYTILFLQGRLRVSENPYYRIFYAVFLSKFCPKTYNCLFKIKICYPY